MNEKTTIDVNKVPRITKFIYTLGILPTSYLMSMTYEEQLVWFTNYLGNTVIPSINENGEAVIELQQLYEELRVYINTSIEEIEADYVKNTDYANDNTAGVIKTSSDYAINTNNGLLHTRTKNYSEYSSAPDEAFIGKGTLENVITGKQLVNKTYVDDLVGDINTALDTINGEVI